MEKHFRISYETMGTSSYMTVTCPQEIELIHYQMEMVLSNEIKNLLSVSRQIMDGDTVLYYNITSRVPLSQILEKRKLKRKEFLCLINGAILAVRDAAEFRLPAEGLIMEPDRIYVNPATCDPAFAFLPVQDGNGKGIKEFLSDLIFHDRIEMANDNLIQVLLKEMNAQPFSIDSLEKALLPYSAEKREISRTPKVQKYEKIEPVPVPVRQAAEEIPLREEKNPERPAMPEVPKLPEEKKKPESRKGKNKKKEIRETKAGTDDGFDAKKARNKFLLPQAFIAAALAAAVSFGLFLEEDGSVAVNAILGVVLAVLLIEIVLYREIYVNGRTEKKETKKKEKKGRNKKTEKAAEKKKALGKRPELPKPAKSAIPGREAPGEESASPLQQEPLSEAPVQRASRGEASAEPVRQLGTGGKSPYQGQESSWPSQPLYQAPVYEERRSEPQIQPVLPVAYETEDTDLAGETELWGDGEENGMPAYLEYFENGKLSRIPVGPQGSVLIGRLKAQVDFAVKSPRVGKIHAKFFCQNGTYYVVDINSKNGTYINGNGARIESNIPYPLRDKDRIMLADCEFTIRCSEN